MDFMENKKSSFRFRHGILLSAIVIALFIFVVSAVSTSASFFDSVLNFFQASSSAPAAGSVKEVPLYRPALDYEQAVVEAVKKNSPAVVAITVSKNVPIIENCPTQNPFGDLPPEFQQFFGDQFQFSAPCEKGSALQKVGGGSGFVVNKDGLILTNRHVVSDAKASYTVFTNDGKKYGATVLARDPVQDLAVLKINSTALSPVQLGDSASLQLGQTAIAIGNTLGEYRNTVSVGVVSGLSRTVTAGGGLLDSVETIRNVIQTDAAINLGNSGGPLLNLRGEVIGINTATVLGAQSVSFAIPINAAKRVISSVAKGGEIQSPYLGVRYLMITPELVDREKLKIESGAIIRGNEQGPAIVSGSPADKAGLVAEDIIIAVNGKKLSKDFDLISAIQEFEVGQTVSLIINRKGKEIKIQVKLDKRPKAAE
jgi:S1-C subfamily serine protease